MVDFVGIGAVLAHERRTMKISQEYAAEIAKVSVDTIRNIEHAYTVPHMETIMVLWDIYGLPKADIWNYYFRDNSVTECTKMLALNTIIASEKKLLEI